MKKKKKTQWLRLDNAAKVFPATSGKRDTKVFRIACELTESVQEEKLNEALNDTLKEFPVFRSVLRKGLFWYYFETTEKEVRAHEERKQVCSPLYDANKRSFLFDVSYYGKRINLEVHHALTDGVGAKMFFTSLVCHYLKRAHQEELQGVNWESELNASIEERLDDSFRRYYDNKDKDSTLDSIPKIKRAYRLHGPTLSEHRIKVIEGHLPVSQIKTLAKQYHTSVTVYLTALVIAAIGERMTVREKRKPVGIMVPVNLRSYFKSNSVRNFFATINVVYDFSKDSGEFEHIIEVVEQSFKTQLTQENMKRKMMRHGALEHNWAARFVPLGIKDFFIKLVHDISDQQYTFAMSNIGIFTVPKELERYIRLFSVFVSTKKKQACICSYQDQLVIAFTSPLIGSEIERNFFRKLSEQGVQIEVAATTGWED